MEVKKLIIRGRFEDFLHNELFRRLPSALSSMPASPKRKRLIFKLLWLLDYGCKISPQNRYVYVNIPKAACSTIKRTLWQLEKKTDAQNKIPDMEEIDKFQEAAESPHFYQDILNLPFLYLHDIRTEDFFKRMEEYFVFTFVRNPYSRLLSAYLDKIAGNAPQKRRLLLSFDMPEETQLSFKDFVRLVARQPLIDMDAHWRPQTVATLKRCLRYDFIGSFENLDADFSFVEQRIFPAQKQKLEVWAPHRTGATDKISSYYDEETISLVQKIYTDDFKTFGYSTKISDVLKPPAHAGLMKNRNPIVKYQRSWFQIFIRQILDETQKEKLRARVPYRRFPDSPPESGA
jgi:hypothetical protein